MDPVALEFEELLVCGYCKQKFNDTDLSPKLLSCKHYFCLQCTRTSLVKGQELYCVYCWKRTDLDDMGPDSLPTYAPVLCLAKNFAHLSVGAKPPPPPPPDKPPPTLTAKMTSSENCHTHAMPLVLWCHTCGTPLCRACASTAEHIGHKVKSQTDAKEHLVAEMQIELASMNKMLFEIQRLAMQQREFLLKILEACVTLKTHVEANLTNNTSNFEIGETRDLLAKLRLDLSMAETLLDVQRIYSDVNLERQRLQLRYHDVYVQTQLDDLIRHSSVLFDFQLLKQALNSIQNGGDATLFLGNSRLLSSPSSSSTNTTSSTLSQPQQQQQQQQQQSPNPVLFLANYCTTQLYSRHVLLKQPPTINGLLFDKHQHAFGNNNNNNNNHLSHHHHHHNQNAIPPSPINYLAHAHSTSSPSLSSASTTLHQQQQQQQQLVAAAASKSTVYHQPEHNSGSMMLASPQLRHHHHQQQQLPTSSNHHHHQQHHHNNHHHHHHQCPMYYFNIEVNGAHMGRVVIEVRADVAPKMARNFGLLATGETGMGYRGCQIFQCWEGESVITGDFELNNGRGGRSVFEESYFLPDDTKLVASRGTVGMRRTQKRHDNLGMVGSQFRIILQEMRGFTGIFGHVVEGLELVEKISTYGDTAGKPTKSIVISKCGKLQ